MDDERMMILSMLEEGKITSEEAIKLLDALGENDSNIHFETYEETEENIEKKNKKNSTTKNFTFQGKKANDFGSNIENLISDMVNNIVNKSLSFGLTGTYETVNKKIEKDISNIENPILDFNTINGSIKVEPWDEEKISLDITCAYKKNKSNKEDVPYNFYEEGRVIKFEPTNVKNTTISLKAKIPNKHYEKIILNTKNGSIKIHGLELDSLSAITKNASITMEDITSLNIYGESTNASIRLKDIESEKVDVLTTNGKIDYKNITSNHTSGQTTNGSIKANNIKSKKAILKTTNGKISCTDIDGEQINELVLSTSNGSIDVSLMNISKMAYFDLETTVGSILLDIPDLVYKVNKKKNFVSKKIIAHTPDFDEDKESFVLKASTLTGSIRIK